MHVEWERMNLDWNRIMLEAFCAWCRETGVEFRQRDDAGHDAATVRVFRDAWEPPATVKFEYSDRGHEVLADDAEAIADSVICWALDHSYDRGSRLPGSLPKALREALTPVVARHLAEARPDWEGHTAEDLEGEKRDAMFQDILAVVQRWQAARRGG